MGLTALNPSYDCFGKGSALGRPNIAAKHEPTVMYDEKYLFDRASDDVFPEFSRCRACAGRLYQVLPKLFLYMRTEPWGVHRGLQQHRNYRQECVPARMRRA